MAGTKDKEGIEKDITKQDLKLKFSYDNELVPHASFLEESYKTLMEIFLADANTPKWSDMGVKNGIKMLKRDADDISPLYTYKGIVKINVPLPYLLTYTHDLTYRNEFDSLYESGTDITSFKDGLTRISHILYRAVWPTVARDFCSLTAVRHLKDNLYGSLAKSIIHAECPERKQNVRGEILIAGYVFEELPGDPSAVRMTHIARCGLNGSIPVKIVNRINADQPLIAGLIKKECERHYEMRDPDTDGMEILNRIKAVPSVFQ